MKYDVIIIGSGLSGVLCALELRSDLNILLVTKNKVINSNSYLAQGGIAIS
jgi:L-aspartate oxidase